MPSCTDMATGGGTWLCRGALGLGVLAVPTAITAQEGGEPEWQIIAPAGETGCGFDTPFEFWVREGDPNRVLIYLQGGGACWTHETCHPDRRIRFRREINSTDHLERRDGIFDRSSSANPFRSHTMVFVPYCTGDFHLGTRRVTYPAPPGAAAGDITVNHAGYYNVRAVLRSLAERPIEPQMVVVTGGSAGAVASPFVAAEVARLLPRTAVRQIGDGAGGLRFPQVRALLRRWGADSVLATRGLPITTDGDALTGMYLTAATRHPRIRFAQVNTSEDATIADGLRMFGQGSERVAANIAEAYAELRAAGICFTGYVLPGTQHTLLWRPEFLTGAVNGRPLPELLEREVLDRPCAEDEADDPGVGPAAPIDSVHLDALNPVRERSSAQRRELAYGRAAPWPDVPQLEQLFRAIGITHDQSQRGDACIGRVPDPALEEGHAPDRSGDAELDPHRSHDTGHAQQGAGVSHVGRPSHCGMQLGRPQVRLRPFHPGRIDGAGIRTHQSGQ